MVLRIPGLVKKIESEVSNAVSNTVNNFTSQVSSIENQFSDVSNNISRIANQFSNPAALGEEITNNLQSFVSDNISVGGLPNIGATSTSRATASIPGSAFLRSAIGTASNTIQPNPLEEYASYNNIFTLGALTPEEVNFPERTYRRNGPTINILRSGGGLGSNKVTTAFESQGRVEYFIDNLDIDSIITPRPGTGTTNATIINFEVVEPYSMGLFLQSLMEAALNAGYANYINAAYVLQIDFIGWDDFGNQKKIENTTRYYPLKFVDVKFNVNQGGCVYQVQAIPYNEQALSDEVQRLKTDISPTGSTLQELLQTGENSLTSIINRRSREQAEAGQISTPDEHIIIFPNANLDLSEAISSQQVDRATQSPEDVARSLGQVNLVNAANIDRITELQQNRGTSIGRNSISDRLVGLSTQNSNSIGTSTIVESILTRGISPMGIDAFVLDENTGNYSRGKISISADLRTFTFGQGMKMQNIIESIVLTSEYARNIVDYNVDTNGMVDWFKIETDVYVNQDLANEARIGRPALVYVYKVVPYKVHSSVFNKASTGGANYNNLRQKVAKEYNYIYTGKNKDIINFDIDINFAFFTGLQDDRGQGSAEIVQGGADAALSETPTILDESDPTGDFQRDGQSPRQNVFAGTAQVTPGTELDSQKIRIARQFHDAIVNSDVDLITLKLDILGDPYFIADSGMGNYNSQNIGVLNINVDGTMEYQNSEVDILLNFRTPIDYKDDDSGRMLFPEETVELTPFSGLYRVIFVRNKWEGNKFTQTLDLIRRPNQEVEGTVTDQRLFTEATTPIGELNTTPPAEIIQQATAKLVELENTVAGFDIGEVDAKLLQAAKQLEAEKLRIAQQAQDAINNFDIANVTNKVENTLSDLARGIRRGF